MIKNCAYCTIEFETANSQKLYHSDSCRSSASQLRCNSKKPKQICLWCTKEFQPKWNKQQCCTTLCVSFYVNNKPEVAEKKSRVLRENGNLKGKKNPSYGKSPSTETKNKISKGVTKYYEENDNPFQDKNHSVETRDLMSQRRTEWLIANGGDRANNKNYITGWYSSEKNQEDFWHASSYELRAYQLLDSMGAVSSYSRCEFSIKYLHADGTTHRYIPDISIIYTGGRKEIVEIKPTTKLKEDLNIRKFKAANKFYKDTPIRYVVWTELTLKQLEEMI